MSVAAVDALETLVDSVRELMSDDDADVTLYFDNIATALVELDSQDAYVGARRTMRDYAPAFDKYLDECGIDPTKFKGHGGTVRWVIAPNI